MYQSKLYIKNILFTSEGGDLSNLGKRGEGVKAGPLRATKNRNFLRLPLK